MILISTVKNFRIITKRSTKDTVKEDEACPSYNNLPLLDAENEECLIEVEIVDSDYEDVRYVPEDYATSIGVMSSKIVKYVSFSCI